MPRNRLRYLPVTTGLLVASYWLISFTVAFFSLNNEGVYSEWWNFAIFRVPGFYLGIWCFDAVSSLTGYDYQVILGDGMPYFFSFLGLVALVQGWLAGLFTRFCIGHSRWREE